MQKYFIKLLIVVLLFIQGQTLLAQVGLNFQGVARTNNNVILASQPISLRLSILQGTANGNVEYSEVRKVTTNAQGLFAVVIGDAEATNTLGSFNSINWKNTPKFLKIEMDVNAGSNYILMGTTQFQYVAYAQFAKSVDAGNINGVIPVEKGGTGVDNLNGLKTLLAIDKINNTSDLEKPISAKTQAALDLILATATDSTRFFNSINLKANTTDVTVGLASKVDKVTGKELSTNDFTNAEKTKLAAITGTNTGDQDLSTYATISALGLKANVLDVYIALALKANSNDVNSALGFKANTLDVNNSLILKENSSNKSAATDLGGASPSDILYPTQKAVKAYITANAASGNIVDGGITTIKLADGAVTDAKVASINGSKVVGDISGKAASVITNANLTGVVTSVGNVTSIASGAISNTMLANTAVANLSGVNTGDETESSIKTKLGVTGFFSGAYADLSGKPSLFSGSYSDLTNKPALFSGSYNDLTNKPDVLTNSLTGTGTSGQLSFFNGTSTVTSSSDLFWDATNKRLGIGNQSPGYPLEINTGNANYGLMISSESSNSWGSGIGFKSSTDATTKTGLFQLDPDGAMVFRTLQDNMYFDNAGNGSMKFRMGDPSTSNIGMTLNNSGNLEVTGTLKTGAVIYPNVVGNDGEVLTFDSQNSKAIWKAPSVANGSITNAMLSNTAVANLSGVNTGDETESSIKTKLGVTGFFSGAYADLSGKPSLFSGSYSDLTNKPALFSGSYNDLTNKPDVLTNSLTGTGTSGQLSFFNGTSTVTSSSDLFWDATNKRLGIGNQSPGYPLEINTGNANYGLMISSESSNSWGSGIGFKSSTDATTKTGLFQLDPDGAMVFRTLQDNMYFDNAGNGSMKFRMGDPSTSNIGMTLNNSGNLEVTGTLKTGAVIYPNVVGNDGEVLTFDSQNSKAIWKAPSVANGSITNAMLSNTAVANLSGVNTGDNAVNARYNYLITDVANLLAANTGDNAINSRYNSLVTNAVHYGDIKPLMTGSDGYNVIGINGTRLLDLQTGILKNTNGTGVPSIAVASDFPTLNQSTTGNAATTTKLAISRNINGVPFDGTVDITIAANAGTLTGTSLNSTVVNSSLTSVGTLSNLTVTNPINGSINGNAASATTATTAGTASTATKLATARNINGVAFDGSAAITVTADAGTLTGTTLKSTIINSSLTSVGTLTNLSVTNPINGSITGNAATATLASSATKFATSRNINGIAFDGTGDITVAANAGTLTGTSLNSTITGSSLTSVGVLNNATVNGKVIVGAATEASSSAILEASSTTQGFLPPRMTIAQRLAIINPVQGLMIYCTNCGTYGEPQYYNGNSWINFAGTATSKSTPTINITIGTYTFTASTPQGPNTATNTGTGSTYAFTYVGTGSTTYASSSTRPTNAGTYSVTVSLSASGDGNYNAATASAAFTIAQAIPTVTPTIGSYNYISGTPQGPTAATNTGTGTNYIYSYTGTGITSYGPSATKPTDGGTYTVIATVAANGNFAASSSAPTAFSIKTNLAVGNTYGGGTVAYILKAGDIGYDANQQHGLIISGDLTANNITWSSNYGSMGSSGGAGIYNNDTQTEDFPSADLQTGLSNTNIIINVEGSGTSYAAGIARAYTGGNYTNWYLPSASQMNAMKTNLITPFTTNYYWTSTEGGDYDAYAYSVPNHDVRGIDKLVAQGKVRAIRSF